MRLAGKVALIIRSLGRGPGRIDGIRGRCGPNCLPRKAPRWC